MSICESEIYLQFRRVLVLYCGGTIGMRRNEHNVYAPVPNIMVSFLKKQKDFHDIELARKCYKTLEENQLVLPEVMQTVVLYEIIEYCPLLDSSNMRPSDWVRLATDVGRYYDNYDGFVLLHGTDTLAYTASALSFMFEGLQKPVILTGSQIPIFENWSHSGNNILHSIILAGCYIVPEVCICFSSKLLRGNRSTKVSCSSIDCFQSMNYHTLVDIGLHIDVHEHYIRRPEAVPFKAITTINTNIAVIRFTPTLMAHTMEAVVKASHEAIIIQTFGNGTIRNNDDEFRKVLKWAIERGIILVNITQCAHGSVGSPYETSKWFSEIGVVSGRDMTCEAAVAKLCYILAQKHLTIKAKIKLFETDLKGEMKLQETEGNPK